MQRSTFLALLVLCAGCGAPSGVADAGFDGSTAFDGGATADAGLDGGAFDSGTYDAGTFDSGFADAGQLTTVVRIHYPAAARTVSMRGSAFPFNWTTGNPMTLGSDDTWTLSTTQVAAGTLEFKPLLDDTNWSRGPN